ncbi:vanadium-dependent haloperoxidase [Archangium violaceum]|uniref:DUF6851 domain-containing protein n=1 Tax=Archangium violaceum TaxID=83451 RepID=UPI002B2F94DE|nr:vanadium-dependent haloperoxidase [Archangium violaceum]
MFRSIRTQAPLKGLACWTVSLLVLLTALLGGCEEPPPPPEPGTWTLVTSERPEALLAVGGRSPEDIYAVGMDRGRGPAVLHYDGSSWSELATGMRLDLWAVFPFQNGTTMMAGSNATILLHEAGRFTRMRTPGLARQTVYSLWGSGPKDVYAVGSGPSRGGFVWHYDGSEWREVELPYARLPRTADGDLWPFFKVWGNGKGEVYVVGGQGMVLRSRFGGAFEVLPTGTTDRLVSVSGMGDSVVVVGGRTSGRLLELNASGQFEDRTPAGSQLFQDVAIAADGTGYVVGAWGQVFHRLNGKWALVDHRLAFGVQSLQGVWVDSRGGMWTVGGNLQSPKLNGGAIGHFGGSVTAASLVPGPVAPPPDTCPAEQVDPSPTGSIARRWNEQLLWAIRRDLPRPTVHARNLYHVSAAMWDAWAAYDATADGTFVHEKHTAPDVAQARAEAISYAAYRVLAHRYTTAIGGKVSAACFKAFMLKLGYDPDDMTVEGEGSRALGNRIGRTLISFGADDGANEQNDYADTTGFSFVNPPLVVDDVGATLVEPSLWQPLNLAVSVTQNGIDTASGVQGYIGAHWKNVTPFAMTRPAGGGLYHTPGPAPAFGDSRMRDDVVEVIRKASMLGGDARIDLSPASVGNNSLGANDGKGYAVNPVTGLPYTQQWVNRGDFGRVLAEFWADGPKSETPPGHWNVLANQVADSPGFQRRLFGTGDSLEPLEWDVKVYLALNGAVHDAAITAWEIKRVFVTVRPISLIRYMGGLGPSHPDGLPLVPGLIEEITAESSAPGQRHASLARFKGQVAVYSWRGEPGDRKNEVGGLGWIRATEWIPYQLRTFVTPAFPGFISGHSTFSRSAAEVLTSLTGSPYFPGGLGEFVAKRDAYLTFEKGPSTDIRLQWASYYDAADQAGQSRLWGGIHIEPDDFVGRRLGSEVGLAAVERAKTFFAGTAVP